MKLYVQRKFNPKLDNHSFLLLFLDTEHFQYLAHGPPSVLASPAGDFRTVAALRTISLPRFGCEVFSISPVSRLGRTGDALLTEFAGTKQAMKHLMTVEEHRLGRNC
jgi:hypothetical protein